MELDQAKSGLQKQIRVSSRIIFFLGSNSNGQELERTYQEELKRNIELQRTEQLQNTLAHYKSQYVTPKKYDSNADIEPWTLGQN